jgi:hypothetical protein
LFASRVFSNVWVATTDGPSSYVNAMTLGSTHW